MDHKGIAYIIYGVGPGEMATEKEENGFNFHVTVKKFFECVNQCISQG